MPDEPLSPFPSTHWTMVAGANADNSRRLRALAELLLRYGPALRSYIIFNYRVQPDRADDLLQGFLADKVLEQDVLRGADRNRGRFRNFLATVLDRYVLNEIRNEKTSKRRPAQGVASLGEHPHLDKAAAEAPDAFDLEWARQVLNLALDRMREECQAGKRTDLWAVFEARVLKPTIRQQDPESLQDLVRRLKVTPEQASNLLGTSKRMFARNLRAVVSEYADGPDAEDEIRSIKAVLAKSPPHAGSTVEWCT